MARPTLKAQAGFDMNLLFNTDMPWEVDCVYTPRGGTETVIPIFLSGQIDTFSRMEEYERGAETAEIYIWAKKADVPAPKWRDKFVFNGETWYFGVMGVVKQDDYSLKIHLERDLSCEE